MKDVLYIIDDHNMVRNGLKSWLEGHTNWKVVKDFEKGSDCLEFLNQLPVDNELFPEILIVDVQLVDESGFALVKEITKQFPQIKISSIVTMLSKQERNIFESILQGKSNQDIYRLFINYFSNLPSIGYIA